MRKYEQIWKHLKELPSEDAKNKGVSVTANRRLHPRIIKAVVKEKWMDIPYKLQKDPQKVILTHTQVGSVLTFYLTLSVKTINAECL